MAEAMSEPAIFSDVKGRIRAREQEVLGQPPRMPPLDRQAVAEEVLAATAHIRGGVVAPDAPPLPLDVIPEIMFILCRFPALWGRLMDVSIQMQSATGVLTARDRQFAILRTAWLLQAPYEWGEHVRHSHKAGITAQEIERVTIGSTAPAWSDHERAIMCAAEELRANAMISDATWQQLAKQMNEAQLFEITVLVGHFTNIAYMQNSMRIRLEPSNPGLSAR